MTKQTKTKQTKTTQTKREPQDLLKILKKRGFKIYM